MVDGKEKSVIHTKLSIFFEKVFVDDSQGVDKFGVVGLWSAEKN